MTPGLPGHWAWRYSATRRAWAFAGYLPCRIVSTVAMTVALSCLSTMRLWKILGRAEMGRAVDGGRGETWRGSCCGAPSCQPRLLSGGLHSITYSVVTIPGCSDHNYISLLDPQGQNINIDTSSLPFISLSVCAVLALWYVLELHLPLVNLRELLGL